MKREEEEQKRARKDSNRNHNSSHYNATSFTNACNNNTTAGEMSGSFPFTIQSTSAEQQEQQQRQQQHTQVMSVGMISPQTNFNFTGATATTANSLSLMTSGALPSSNPTIQPSILVQPVQVPTATNLFNSTTPPFVAHHINNNSAYTQVQAASQQHLASTLAHQQAAAVNTIGLGTAVINPTSMLNVSQQQQQQSMSALLRNHLTASVAGTGQLHPSLQQHGLLNTLTTPQNVISTTVPSLTTTTTATAKLSSLPPTPNLTSVPQSILLPNPSLGLTVQDHPNKNPIYNGVNPNYPNLNVLNQNPPIFSVTNFLTTTECDFLINVAQDCFSPAPVVGKGAGEVSPSRTSSTCYLAREDLPRYLAKVCALTGKPVEHCELPQVGRYYPSQQYLQHFDAFDLSNEDGRRFASNGGQRTVTVLVYLNDVERGGTTFFPNLNLDVKPQKGMALVFFPSTVDGYLDKNALHAAKPAIDTKYVSQVWIRQGRYEGLPSKRMFSSVDQAMLVQKSLIAAREGHADDEIGILNTTGISTG